MAIVSRTRAAIVRAVVVVKSAAMRGVVDELEAIARTEAPVLIQGERGTGREMIARVIHLTSARKQAPFATMEADVSLHAEELGPKVVSVSGTLLVKDVVALSRESQSHLARVVVDISDTNARIVGTCVGDLGPAVEAGMFDRPLYERLSQQHIHLPPLRDRSDDIAPLMTHFVNEYGNAVGHRRIAISTRAFELLVMYPWPGNVAELKQIARGLVIRCKGARIEVGDVDALLPTVVSRVPLEDMPFEEMVQAKLDTFLQRFKGYEVSDLHGHVLARVEQPLLSLIMRHTGGNQLKAADMLGLNRNTLRRKLSHYGIAARPPRARRRN